MRSINGGLMYVNIQEVQYSCTCQCIYTLHLTICCRDGIISNILRDTQYIISTWRIQSLANGTLRTTLQPSYSITFSHPPIKNLNEDMHGFLWHRFRSTYYAQSQSVQEPAFITNMKKTMHAKYQCSHYRPGVAQRVGRGIALLFHDRGTRMG